MSDVPDRLAELGWTPEIARKFEPYRSAHQLVRVCRVDRGGADVAGAAGTRRVTFGGDVLRRAAANHVDLPVVGDWVAVRDWPDRRATLEVVLPRRTAVVRDSAGTTSHGQVLAANVDLMAIVEHLDPEPEPGRIERLLVIAWGSGAQPLVVLTKADLVPDPDGMRAEVAAVAPGVEVLAISATTGQGVDALRSHLGHGRTLAFFGASGAGKSTLINLLAGKDVMATGSVRAVDGRGRHTTTHRELIVLPGRGVIVDSPGLRSIGLVTDDDAVARTFPDVEGLAGDCRFRDCAHQAEPGCAVLAAFEAGDLSEDRLTSWRKLRRETAFHTRRSDARQRAQDVASWKQRTKALRLHYKNKG